MCGSSLRWLVGRAVLIDCREHWQARLARSRPVISL
jgi:hypothetical protein